MKGSILNTVLNAVGLAMGIAVLVISLLNPDPGAGLIPLLGLGLAAVGLANLRP